ncbi:MAG TPA: COX15/CtaA family protein, partial [Paracoccaceae bacterium]|nr:COX15/CtaA family protein [Paracoccaceae bacterium]
MSQKRSIFEEVSEKRAEPPKPATSRRKTARRAIAVWLMVLFTLVTVMIAVGGMTRLTDSGLSITEWKPVTGSIPPMSAEVWASEFEKYQQTPEFQLQNHAMSLAEFKGIYWWEWGHRFLGRFIGLVWALGFFWFLIRRQIPTGWTGKLVGVGVLGGLQGAVGWWMVASGLTGRMVDVASYRLATHLGLAFVILGLIAWFVFQLSQPEGALLQQRRQREKSLMSLSGVIVGVLFLQILLGALVAGIDAGRSFPTWPSMAGAFLPSESFDYAPMWSNFFENPALVQFNHRMLGYIASALGAFAWWRSRASALGGVR